MEERIAALFDFQHYEKNGNLQAVIDAVHARYGPRQLDDDEAELVAAAGVGAAAPKRKQPKDDGP